MQTTYAKTSFILVCCLKACGSIRATLANNEIHKDIVQIAFERDYFIGNTSIDIYAKYGSLSDAPVVFNRLSVHKEVFGMH